jgi:NSS family neurotransmitter:Na+ symporter
LADNGGLSSIESVKVVPAPGGAPVNPSRETFGSRFSTVMAMIGVAVGLGNLWRFPYMVGEFGGAAFVVLYLLAVVFFGVPALMAEWVLGRHTRRGPMGAFERAGVPFGRALGWLFFVVVIAATGYYASVIGWVLAYAVGQVVPAWDPSRVLPPATGFDPGAFLLGAGFTALVILACVGILLKGVKAGIEAASRIITPMLFVALLAVIVRSVTLPGSFEGISWFILKFDPSEITPVVMVAALGQAAFSLALGGTFMVVYGSYLSGGEGIPGSALLTAFGDTSAGLLAGLAIFPAVFAYGLEPGSGPDLLFVTLPQVFRAMPLGWLFGLLFFVGLLGVAYLSAVAAFEVLVAGLTDNTRLSRRTAVWLMALIVFGLSLPPTVNMGIFVPWDLTFGSGMQMLGALLTVLTVGWSIRRSKAIRELAIQGEAPIAIWLHRWMRFVVPAGFLIVAAWWLLSEVLRVAGTG